MNTNGFRKILKKFEKHTKVSGSSDFWLCDILNLVRADAGTKSVYDRKSTNFRPNISSVPFLILFRSTHLALPQAKQ